MANVHVYEDYGIELQISVLILRLSDRIIAFISYYIMFYMLFLLANRVFFFFLLLSYESQRYRDIIFIYFFINHNHKLGSSLYIYERVNLDFFAFLFYIYFFWQAFETIATWRGYAFIIKIVFVVLKSYYGDIFLIYDTDTDDEYLLLFILWQIGARICVYNNRI